MSRHKESFFQRKLLDSSTVFSPSLVSWVSFVVSITGQLGCQTPACYFIFTHLPSWLLRLIGSIFQLPVLVCGFQWENINSKCWICEATPVSFQISRRTLPPFPSTLSGPARQRSRGVVTAPSPTLRPSSLCHPACLLLLLPPPCPSLHTSSPLAP